MGPVRGGRLAHGTAPKAWGRGIEQIRWPNVGICCTFMTHCNVFLLRRNEAGNFRSDGEKEDSLWNLDVSTMCGQDRVRREEALPLTSRRWHNVSITLPDKENESSIDHAKYCSSPTLIPQLAWIFPQESPKEGWTWNFGMPQGVRRGKHRPWTPAHKQTMKYLYQSLDYKPYPRDRTGHMIEHWFITRRNKDHEW